MVSFSKKDSGTGNEVFCKKICNKNINFMCLIDNKHYKLCFEPITAYLYQISKKIYEYDVKVEKLLRWSAFGYFT